MIPANVIIFPCRFGTGDYQIILVDFKFSNVAGYRINICSSGIWRLIYDNKIAIEKYIKKTLELLLFYQIDKKLDKLEKEWVQRDNLNWATKLDIIDIQVIGLLLYTEKKCRKFRIGKVDYSPKVSKVAEIQHMQRKALKVAQESFLYNRELTRVLHELVIEVGNLANI